MSNRSSLVVRAGLLVPAVAGLVLAGWGAGELVLSLHPPDLQIGREVTEGQSAALTRLAHPVSWAGSALVIGPLAVICAAVLLRLSGPAAAAAVVLSAAGAMVISTVDKLLVARPRPPVAHLEAVTHSSFPSAHATLSAAFYVGLLIALLSLRAPRAASVAASIGTVALVSAVALSRIYLGVHYPTDVIAGVLLGAAWAVLVAGALGRLGRRRWPREDPEAARRARPQPAAG